MNGIHRLLILVFTLTFTMLSVLSAHADEGWDEAWDLDGGTTKAPLKEGEKPAKESKEAGEPEAPGISAKPAKDSSETEKSPLSLFGLKGYSGLVDGSTSESGRSHMGFWATGRLTTLETAILETDSEQTQTGAFFNLQLGILELAAQYHWAETKVNLTPPGNPGPEFQVADHGDLRAASKLSLDSGSIAFSPYVQGIIPTGSESGAQRRTQIEGGVAMKFELMEDSLYFLANLAGFQDDPKGSKKERAAIYRLGLTIDTGPVELFGYWEGFYYEGNKTLPTDGRHDAFLSGGLVWHVEIPDSLAFSVTLAGEALWMDDHFLSINGFPSEAEQFQAFIGISFPLGA